jgi:hypothetical protein
MRKVKFLSLPVLLLLTVILAFIGTPYMSHWLRSFFYTISMNIKNVILEILPFLIIILISNSLLELKGRIVSFVSLLICAIIASNYFAVIFGFTFGLNVGKLFIKEFSIAQADQRLDVLYLLPTFNLIRNELALCIGVVIAFIIKYYRLSKAKETLRTLDVYANQFLKTFLVPVLPFFIFGFIIKIINQGILDNYSHYGMFIIMFITSQITYAFIYLNFTAYLAKISPLVVLKRITPALVTGFSTCSSMAALPLTIAATEKNIKDKSLARTVIPATTNVHVLGTAIGINANLGLCYCFYGLATPDLYTIALYAFIFALTMFATVGVPGGSIFILAPVVSSYLGVSPEIIALITTLNLLLDPIDTSFNITMNSFFAILFAKIHKGKK